MAAIIIGFISDKIQNKKILINFVAIFVAAMYLLAYFFNFFLDYPQIILILFGISAGLSIISPTFFASRTGIRERGRIQGVCAALLYPLYLIQGILTGYNVFILLYVFLGLAFALPIIFLIFPSKQKKSEDSRKQINLLKDRPFFLYSISFFFLIIALSFIQIFIDNTAELFYTAIIFTISLSVICIIGGIVTDLWGRKKSILFIIIIIGGSFFIFGIFLQDFSFFSMLPIVILAAAGNGLDLVIEPVITADFAGPRSRGKYNASLYTFVTLGIIVGQAIFIYFIHPLEIINIIPQISLVVIFSLLLSITPLMITKEPIDISLSREVKVMGVFLTSPDGRVLVESNFTPIKIDSTLAMSALSGVSNLITETLKTKKHLKTIDYEEAKIIIEYGQYSNAYLIADKETLEIREKLKQFLSTMEKRYGRELAEFSGNLSTFQPAYSVIGEIFGLFT
ncbi:MAG: MFS transporter [Promethearchaeota archaeon]|nr:MAG: MFS transporter [Candidatus Lokiarchaeota archaeon]